MCQLLPQTLLLPLRYIHRARPAGGARLTHVSHSVTVTSTNPGKVPTYQDGPVLELDRSKAQLSKGGKVPHGTSECWSRDPA